MKFLINYEFSPGIIAIAIVSGFTIAEVIKNFEKQTQHSEHSIILMIREFSGNPKIINPTAHA